MTEGEIFVRGEPPCSNCSSTDIESMFSEEGQYKGSWCEDCGCMSYCGMSRRPSFYKIQQEIIEGLEDSWREKIYDSVYDTIVEYCWEEGVCEEKFSEEDISNTVEEFLDNAFEGFVK